MQSVRASARARIAARLLHAPPRTVATMRAVGALLARRAELARALSTSAAPCAVPVQSEAISGGLFGMLTAKPSMPPMDVPLQGLDPVTPAAVSSTPPPTEVVTLKNGIRLGCQNVMGPLSAIGIVVEAGSANEPSHMQGVAQLMEALAFKGTPRRTHFATVRQAENYGVNLTCMVSRESIVYTAVAPRDNVAAATELLCDSVARPLFADHIVTDALDEVGKRNAESLNDLAFQAAEGVVSAAYEGPLARPVLWDGQQYSAADVQAFHDEMFTSGNMLVAAAGVPLATGESLVNEFLGDLPARGATPQLPSRYVGGSGGLHTTQGATALVAFETCGWQQLDDSIVSTVVQFLLGGGADFSSGGPGKGMHSRLYRNVLAQNAWVSSALAYANVFEKTGLAGILISTADASRGGALVDALCRELEGLAKGVTSEEVERAKKMCEAQVYGMLEMPNVAAEDIGRQLASYGRRLTLEEFASKLKAVDKEAVNAYIKKLMSSKPSGMLLGDQATMPKFDTVASRFS